MATYELRNFGHNGTNGTRKNGTLYTLPYKYYVKLTYYFLYNTNIEKLLFHLFHRLFLNKKWRNLIKNWVFERKLWNIF